LRLESLAHNDDDDDDDDRVRKNNKKKHVQHAAGPVASAAAVTKRYCTGNGSTGHLQPPPVYHFLFVCYGRADDCVELRWRRQWTTFGASASTNNFAFSRSPARARTCASLSNSSTFPAYTEIYNILYVCNSNSNNNNNKI
jgi:hypothetical protein